ncbi:hypothetical protein Tco_0882863, partial [Tanacetum coccineum]
MTRNKSFLTDYQEIVGGFVAFGGSPKGGKITGKGKIRTGKLDFKDVYFVKELKFNLFSVLQMCDKKNSVLFTKTQCLVLSPDFKLLDCWELNLSHLVLPREELVLTSLVSTASVIQYLTHTDYALWEVIMNGDAPVVVESASTGAEAIKNRFGGNKESKKMHKTILKQDYENFTASSQEGLDKTYDRSLPLAWNNIALIMRNKSDLDTLRMDYLYNNLKVYEFEIKGKSSSSSNSLNVAFVSLDNSSSTNETVNTAHSISTASSKDEASTVSYANDFMFSFFANQSNAPQLDYEDLEQIDA